MLIIIRFYYDSYVHIVPDTDGVRLLTNEVCDFLQNVPGRCQYPRQFEHQLRRIMTRRNRGHF